MKRNCLCIILVLLMCLSGVLPTFADSEKEPPEERTVIVYSFDLKHVSGSTYKMQASVTNPDCDALTVALALYDSNNNMIDSVAAVSSDLVISLSKNVSLSSGTYTLRIAIIGLSISKTKTKVYTI